MRLRDAASVEAGVRVKRSSGCTRETLTVTMSSSTQKGLNVTVVHAWLECVANGIEVSGNRCHVPGIDDSVRRP